MLSSEMMPIFAALLAAGAIAAVVFAFMYPYITGANQQNKRVATVTENRAKKVATRSAAEVAANRKKQVTETLKDLEARQKAREKVTLRVMLQRAGLDIEPRMFWIGSALMGVVVAIVVFFAVPPSPTQFIAAGSSGLIGALGLPRFILSRLIKSRQQKFLRELANAIDVVVRGIKSGLPLGECLQIIARESPEPIASEFREVVEQQRVGVTLPEALERLVTRMPVPEVKFLSIVIAIQQQAGGNLSEALGNLSGVLRDRFRMQLKVKALSAEAKASAAVLASLPPGVMTMVYMSSPDYLMPLFNTGTGRMIVIFGICWMLTGVMVMRKMINFKY